MPEQPSAIVTGASAGIGLAVSRMLRQRIAGMTALNAMNDLLADLRRNKTNDDLVRALAASA